MINARNLLSAILFLAVTGLPVYGRSSSSVSAAAADTTIGYSSDTVFKASGDTVVKHRYLTRIKKTGDTVVRRNNFFRRFYHYFESANEDKTLTKKFDFSIIGGPHYSSDTKLGLGLVAAGLYRTGKGDTLTPPSNVSLFGDITTTGFYLLGVRGNTLFEQSKYRLDFTAYFFSFPGAFWGIGYRDATYNQAESYKRLQNQIKVDFMFRVSKNFYLGVSPSFNYIEGRDFPT